jgi:WD40 repeat protein
VGEKSADKLPPEASEVAKEWGYLPLALAMIGAMIHSRPTGWTDALTRLCRADFQAIKRRLRTLEGHSREVTGVAITPDGRRAVSASWDDTLRVWDLESGQTLRTLDGHTDPVKVKAVAVAPDGRCAVPASDDPTLRLWDMQSGKEIATFTGESDMVSCAVTLDGRTIVAGDASGRVHFLGSSKQMKQSLQSARQRFSC